MQEQDQENKVNPDEEHSEFVLPLIETKAEVVTPVVPRSPRLKRLATITPRRVAANANKRLRLTLEPIKKKKDDEKDAVFEVERITNQRVINGQLQYRVHWKNFKTPSWVSQENLMCDDLIKEYEKRIKEGLNRNKKKGKVSTARKVSAELVKKSVVSTRQKSKSVSSTSKTPGAVMAPVVAEELKQPAISTVNEPTKSVTTAAKRSRSIASSSKVSNSDFVLPPEVVNKVDLSLRHESSIASRASNTTSAGSAAQNDILDAPTVDGVITQTAWDEKPPIRFIDWSIIAVKRGSFPDQSPVAHVHNPSTDEHVYVPTEVLVIQCPQKLVKYYEEYLNLKF